MATKIRKKLGRQIRRLRGERKITQEDLALAANVERSYLGQIERGEKNPSLDKIAAIAKVLRVNPKDLL